MLRVFSEDERIKMGEVKSKDIEYMYPNKAFIMINTRNNMTIINGRECIDGVIGYLYAMADYSDWDAYTDEVSKASDLPGVTRTAAFANFPLKDGIYYVE